MWLNSDSIGRSPVPTASLPNRASDGPQTPDMFVESGADACIIDRVSLAHNLGTDGDPPTQLVCPEAFDIHFLLSVPHKTSPIHVLM